jgi:omega-hydroxy-beta-dihydromenaquinone-9 sulfotransferase
LMILDTQFNYPTTYQCMDPHHFLLSEGLMKKFESFFIRETRPMDRMASGWDRPQEDEFALCILGQPSPYLQIAWPNEAEIDFAAYNLDGITSRQKRQWKSVFLRFLKTVAFRDPRQLVLKSPPHTCRIPTILELFPKAKFIHIVRNPYVVFPSTMNLWKSISVQFGFQTPDNPQLKERVLRTHTHMYNRLDETRHLIPAGQYHELKYEDLIANPVGEIEAVYSELGLNGFAGAKPKIEQYWQDNATYETNKYTPPPETLLEVGKRWKEVIDRHEYTPPAQKLRTTA